MSSLEDLSNLQIKMKKHGNCFFETDYCDEIVSRYIVLLYIYSWKEVI